MKSRSDQRLLLLLRGITLLGVALLLCFFASSPSHATEGYAVKTGKGCIFCHQASTGGPLKTTGFAYIRNGYRYPIPEGVLKKAQSLQSPFHRTVRFIIGYLHLLAAVIFFGAIFYIHLFIKPSRLVGGIPKPERILGVSCMVTLALTGIYLTWIRISRWEQFVDNIFGLMLLLKILLFVLMMAIGVIAITVIHRRMGREARRHEVSSGADEISLGELGHFDGSSGKPAYIVFQGKIYDVSNSPKWKEGRHFAKHSAGSDLTDALEGAPHGAEVFEKVTAIGEIKKKDQKARRSMMGHRIFVTMAYTNLVIIFLILACISVWRWGFPLNLLPGKSAGAVGGTSCIDCHKKETPGIYHGWVNSVHAKVGVRCDTCHEPARQKPVVSEAHLQYDPTPVSLIVTPKNCGGCHPQQVAQYLKSKHAHTIEIMWKVDKWLNDGMNNAIERTTGCFACHGTVVEMVDSRPVPGTWPNVGVGRKNPDGSLGSCSSCHTRHRFSVTEARKPEACDQCHLGPDHPQIEIYNESKHGTIYHAEGRSWKWRPDDGHWRPGRDFRAPTCAACHMSAVGNTPGSHDVTERLSWETQAPLTVRPSEFIHFPAETDWKVERAKMGEVCLQCHSQAWTEDHFSNLDHAVKNYNENYFKPIKRLMDSLYDDGLLSRARYFDEDLEWEFYELWHHEGRRARMGAAMMAPDYAWWHGFYELKHRFIRIVQAAQDLRERGHGYIHEGFPGKYGR